MEQTMCIYKSPPRHKNKGTEKSLNLTSVNMIDPVTGWFKIMQYDNKREISITDFFETTWLTRQYPRTMEITFDQVSEFICHDIINYLIEIEYGITSKPITSGNSTYNVNLEQIQEVLRNLLQKFNNK